MSGVNVVALRAAAEAANHGPWEAESETVWQVDLDGQPNMVATRAFEPDAVFIAAANPTVVLALLDRVSELEAVVERVRVLAADWSGHSSEWIYETASELSQAVAEARDGPGSALPADLSDFQAEDVQRPTPDDDERDNEEIR